MEQKYWSVKCRACGWKGSSEGIHANSKDDFMHCPHCASILIEEADNECDIPPLGWRCTRAKGHTGPCAAVECQEDVAVAPNVEVEPRAAAGHGRPRMKWGPVVTSRCESARTPG
jgi:hypothetical protein